MTDVFLNDTWALYFHDPYDEKWDKDSYKQLGTISSIQDVAQVQHAFQDIWAKGMFFLMREHVLPLWEDENNRNGGCFSYKIMKPEVPRSWYELCTTALGETLNTQKWANITGISISPKRNYCILRVWISDRDHSNARDYNIMVPQYTSVLFKPHQENKDYESKN